MMQFSSGTTGEPKPLFYRHGAAPATAVTMKIGNGIGKDDVYFCPSSPGWGHGIWFGTIAPLMFGKAIGTFSGKFDPELVLETLQDWKVTSMAAISSHYRLIIEHPNVEKYNVCLKTIVSTGEKMAKGTIEKIYRVWGIYPCVQYGSTEVGSISMDYAGIKNWKIKPGSLGRPMIGGMKVALLDENDKEVPTGEIGQVSLRKKSGWVKVGDSAYADQDGYLWYVGRIDDVIISSGYTIGPIEVESVINQHEAVEESAVVASPDESRGNVAKAYVVLKDRQAGNQQIEDELKDFVKTKLSKHEYPRLIEFVDELPKTPDGKLKRKVLRQKELKKYKN
jgi:acetyl-CoA synthetase